MASSKRFRGKTCVYCGVAPATTGDHILARGFFLRTARQNLPKAPACQKCNSQKSNLETYLSTVLPFGAKHRAALANLEEMVPPRLARNEKLRRELDKGIRKEWHSSRGGILQNITVLPFDHVRFEELCVLIVKGLLWHHWKVLLGPIDGAQVACLNSAGEVFVERLLAMNAAQNVSEDLGDGTFSYVGVQGVDDPKITVWRMSFYGGINLCGDTSAPTEVVNYVGGATFPGRLVDSFGVIFPK